jgi:hypothetical protein
MSGGFNLFGAMGPNNPVRYIDPSGLTTWVCTYSGVTSGVNHGHVGLGVNTTDSVGYYPTGSPFGSPGTVLPDNPNAGKVCYPLDTTPAQEAKIANCLKNLGLKPGTFFLPLSNCATHAGDCLREGGVNAPATNSPTDLGNWAKNFNDQNNNKSQAPPSPTPRRSVDLPRT